MRNIKNLNKCFIKLTTSNVLYKKQKPEVVASFEILVLDINTNKEYGRFINVYQKDRPALCKVEERTCRDLEEWESLTKNIWKIENHKCCQPIIPSDDSLTSRP